MNSELPQSISPKLLVYQNRQLSRLVRNYRASCASVHLESDIATEVDSGSLIESLIERNRYLEARMLRNSIEKNFGHPIRNQANVFTPHDEPVPDIADASSISEELDTLRKECVRLSTALSIVTQRQEHLDHPKENTESSFYAPKRTIESVDDTSRHVLDKLCIIEASCDSNNTVFAAEIDRLSNIIIERDREIYELRSRESKTSEHTMPHTSCEQIPTTASDIVPQAVRDQLRQKEEQISRMLAQHVSMQGLLSDAEKEIALLREAQVINFDALIREAKHILDRPILNHVILEQGLYDEIKRRDEYIEMILSDRDDLVREIKKLEVNGKSFMEVLKHIQDELETAKKQFSVEMRRVRSLGTGLNGPLANLELEDLKKKVQCSLCKTREKSVVLITCMHCYCRECVNEQMLSARNRKCPLCMQRFSDAEVRDVHFLHD